MKALKILIIEDELITATAIQESLEREGHEVTAIVRTMQEAQTALHDQIPDLALLDIWLEDSRHSGIDIAQQLLLPQSVPFIYLTSQSSSSLVEAAHKTHPSAYLLKPFRRRELAIQVELAYLNHDTRPETKGGAHASESLFLPTDQGRGHVRIMKKDVVYMLAAGAYVEVNVRTGNGIKKYVFSMNLGYLEQFFPSSLFYRLSRSLVVNLDYVQRVEKNQLFVPMQEKPIPFPESQHRELLMRLSVIKTP